MIEKWEDIKRIILETARMVGADVGIDVEEEGMPMVKLALMSGGALQISLTYFFSFVLNRRRNTMKSLYCIIPMLLLLFVSCGDNPAKPSVTQTDYAMSEGGPRAAKPIIATVDAAKARTDIVITVLMDGLPQTNYSVVFGRAISGRQRSYPWGNSTDRNGRTTLRSLEPGYYKAKVYNGPLWDSWVSIPIRSGWNFVVLRYHQQAEVSYSMTVRVESVSTKPGRVIFPVTVSGSGLKIAGGSISVRYDPNHYTPVEVLRDPTVLTYGFFMEHNTQAGEGIWRLSFANKTGFDEEGGVMFYLAFECKEPVGAFSLSGFLFNEEGVGIPINRF